MRNVVVCGAGTMGGGIAQVCAAAGLDSMPVGWKAAVLAAMLRSRFIFRFLF